MIPCGTGSLAGTPPPAPHPCVPVASWPCPRPFCPPVSHSLIASLLPLLAPGLASSRRPDPSTMEVEPKKLKGKRELIMPKSFQQVDFWCKWSLGLFLAFSSLHPFTLLPPPHPISAWEFAALRLMIGPRL